MSRARSDNLSALSSVVTSSRDPQLAPLEIHAATDVNVHQRPERPDAAPPSNHVSRDASPRSLHRPQHQVRESNLSSSIGWKGKNLLTCGKHSEGTRLNLKTKVRRWGWNSRICQYHHDRSFDEAHRKNRAQSC